MTQAEEWIRVLKKSIQMATTWKDELKIRMWKSKEVYWDC